MGGIAASVWWGTNTELVLADGGGCPTAAGWGGRMARVTPRAEGPTGVSTSQAGGEPLGQCRG